MSDAIHCDREGCDTWSRKPEDHGFLAVNWWGDHLPECVDAMIPDFHNERWVCICAALRACEERVEESMDRAWAKATLEIEAHARSLALDAARKAVWESLTAIDALREKS